MAEAFLHIAYLPQVNYVHPLLNALHASSSKQATAVLKKWESEGIGTKAVALASKLVMLEVVVRRLSRTLSAMHEEVASNDSVSEAIAEAKSMPLSNRVLPFELLVDIDAFIFEFRSTYEILGRFVKAVYKALEKKAPTESEILAILQSRGVPIAWADVLRAKRKLHFHEIAPWVAYRVESVSPFKGSIIFTEGPGMSARLVDTSLSLEGFDEIHSGLVQVLEGLQASLLLEIAKL